MGTVAAGVVKAGADHVVIAGHDGGTGASPLSSIQSRGRAVGDRPGRDAADAARERPALARDPADRRPDAHRARRRDRGAPGRRRVRLLDRSPDRDRLHHDARLPPQHLPGRRRDPGPRAPPPLHRQARARRELPLPRRRGGAPDPRRPGRPLARRAGRPGPAPRAGRGDRPLEGARRRPLRPPRRRREPDEVSHFVPEDVPKREDLDPLGLVDEARRVDPRRPRRSRSSATS